MSFDLSWTPAPPTFLPAHWDGSAFAVSEAATASIDTALAAFGVLARARGLDGSGGPTSVEPDRALGLFSSFVEVDGGPAPMWGELSGYYRDRHDRPIQLHCNFAHHAAGVAATLGVAEDRDAFARVIGGLDAFELEAELIEGDLVGAAQRSLAEWHEHPHRTSTVDLPLVEVVRLGDADPRPLHPTPTTTADSRAASGVRVLDFSRVLAGPVCGQTLAAFGADVLRVGAADLPAVDTAVLLTGAGKRNTFLDLRSSDGRRRANDLAAAGHIVIDAFRPGALEARGLGPETLAASAPGLVIVQISAFDWVGPWAGRRGFDSIVQTTSGISHAGTSAAGRSEPTPLPVQALDYATGYLAAAAAARLVAHQQTHGGSWLARLSLLRTRNWLLARAGPRRFTPRELPDLSGWLIERPSAFGRLRTMGPVSAPTAEAGTAGVAGPEPLGTSRPEWLPS